MRRENYGEEREDDEEDGKKKTGDGVWLNFIPVFDKDIFEDDVVEKLKVYLVNQNEEEYKFSYDLVFGGESHFELKNAIRGLSDFYLHDVKFEDLSDSPRFDFEFSLVQEHKKKAPYYEASLKLKGKQIFNIFMLAKNRFKLNE